MLDPKPQMQLSYLIFHLRSKASTCEGTSTKKIYQFLLISFALSPPYSNNPNRYSTTSKMTLISAISRLPFFITPTFCPLVTNTGIPELISEIMSSNLTSIGSRLIERFCFVNGYLYLVEEKSFLSIFERTLSHFRNSSSLTNISFL